MVSNEMRIEYQDLNTLLRAERNPKHHYKVSLGASMNRWGFTQPLAVDDRTGRIVEGHGRLDVLQELRQAGAAAPIRVQVKGKKWLVPIVRGVSFASDAEAEAYLIAANQLTTAGGWNDSLLNQMMADLQTANVGFEGLGFDQGKINAMLAAFAPSAEKLANIAPPAPVFTATAPAGVEADPAHATVAAPAPVAADLPPAITPAAVVTSDGQFSPPPTSMPLLDEGQTPEDIGVLDPTVRIESEHAPKVMRTVLIGRYHIPCSAEESANLDRLISAWQDKTGSLYGFFTAHLAEPPADF
jgi:hypothetical protein